MSGLHVNLEKSEVVPVGDVSDMDIFSGILGCQLFPPPEISGPPS